MASFTVSQGFLRSFTSACEHIFSFFTEKQQLFDIPLLKVPVSGTNSMSPSDGFL